jgi:hypothetical protein
LSTLSALATLLAALAARFLLLLTRLLLPAAALLTTLTALLTTLVLTALLLTTLAWVLISHDFYFSCRKIPAKDNVHSPDTFLSRRSNWRSFAQRNRSCHFHFASHGTTARQADIAAALGSV